HRDDLLQLGFQRFSEGSRDGRLQRPHDTLDVEAVVHHVRGLNSVTRYRYRGNTIPNPWALPTTP
ncbi:MAG: hypothetical protein ACR2M1_13535, partial [Gemmatimonadaceae bacterium]